MDSNFFARIELVFIDCIWLLLVKHEMCVFVCAFDAATEIDTFYCAGKRNQKKKIHVRYTPTIRHDPQLEKTLKEDLSKNI